MARAPVKALKMVVFPELGAPTNATRSGETGTAAMLIPGSGHEWLDVDGSDVVSAQTDTVTAELDLERTA